MFQKSTKTMVKEAVVQNSVGLAFGLVTILVTLVGFVSIAKKINSTPKTESSES